MKKTLTIVLALLTAALCSCAKSGAKPEKLSPTLNCEMTFDAGGQTFGAELKREKDGSWQCVFTEPETVEGLCFEKTEGVITLSRGGLNYIADPSQLPETSPVSLIWQAADRIIANKGTKSEVNKKGRTEITGSLDGEDFKAVIKKEKLLTLDIGEELSVSFK